jgi:7-cyano-7-deazaguanine synthase in queuosine biosynthesis
VRPIEVVATAGRPRRPRRRTRSTAFFSRGVDSTFAAARDRAGPRRHDALVFVDEIEPRHDESVRAAEITAAREAADRLELPLIVMSSSVRTFMDPLTRDWEDALAPALSCLAHALAQGASSMLVPSGDDYLTVEPAGSSPLLDPLFSTERMRIEHDSLMASRMGKVRWLARERPDLLRQLKVCFKENRVDNCGTCGKCLLTMACLDVVGSLDRAEQVPDELDVEAISRMRLPHLKARFEWI